VVPIFHVIRHIFLKEANVIFELNGELFRKPATLQSSAVTALDNVKDTNEEWFEDRSVHAIAVEFDSDLRHGAHERPDLPGAQLAAVAKSIPGHSPVGRLILGEEVRFEQGGWRYANGSQVPDALLDKSSGAPPLRPSLQRPVTEAAVANSVTDIKRTLGAIKSCQVYAGASRDTPLWSVLSPSFELDDAGVIASRYVLSTRPGQGYAQGAVLANLSLLAAQIQDRGGLYFNGDGVPQDKHQAESWFEKAQTCGGSDLEWMRDKAARYQEKPANGKLPAIPTPPPGAGLVKLGNSILAMMSMTLGFDVLAADAEEKMANMSLAEMLARAQRNRKSACANNLGLSSGAC
jgi:hypothetical protein